MATLGNVVKVTDASLEKAPLDGVSGVLEVVGKLTSIPVFGPCAEALRAIYTVANDFQENKELVVRLASRCAGLVEALADRVDSGSPREPLLTHIVTLTDYLQEIATTLEVMKGKPKWNRELNSSSMRKDLEEIGNRLDTMASDFQLAASLNLDAWSMENGSRPPFMGSPYMHNRGALSHLTEITHADRMQLLFDLARGVQYLRGNDILYRDLKPANLPVDDSDHALVADFGFAAVNARGKGLPPRPCKSKANVISE
ncbi:hypothetical protein HDU93_008968 [Gonapodya sp. JEL0774]|nr:hypothetical protein HDU93_008968 [Gonapodya sp. JEL0774]